jgi:cbb3-type cytochrome oxidase subunit 3
MPGKSLMDCPFKRGFIASVATVFFILYLLACLALSYTGEVRESC